MIRSKAVSLAIVFIILSYISLFLRAEDLPPKSEQTASEAKTEPLFPQFNLNQLIASAFEDNLAIKTAKQKWINTIEKYPQSTAYPDPMVMYNHIPTADSMTKPRNRLTLSQDILYPGKLNLKGESAQLRVQMAKTEYEMTVRDVIVDLEKAYFELLYLKNAQELTKNNLKIVTELAKVGESDYAKDVTSLNDVLKAQAQAAQLNYDLVLLTELNETQKTIINTLLNQSPAALLGSPEEVSLPPQSALNEEELYRLAETNQLEQKMATLSLREKESMEKVAKKESYPDFKIELMYETGEMMPPEIGVGFGFNIPLGKE